MRSLNKLMRMVANAQFTFADVLERTKQYYSEQLKNSKAVNGSSVSSHLQAAIKMEIANGLSEEEAHAKWRVPLKKEAVKPDCDVWYCISLYNKFFDIRTYGMNGLNPLSLYDVECYERRYGRMPEVILKILYELDDIYYANRE